MVSFQDIQTAYYMMAATGVLVAAVFYILNLRMSQRNQEISMKNQELMLKAQEQTLENRRIEMLDNIAVRVSSEESMKIFYELMNHDWTDYADFNTKYGSENNLDATAKRISRYNSYNRMGTWMRRGLVNIVELYDLMGPGVAYFWEKYKPIIEETRRRTSGPDYCRNMEYLAAEMLKFMQSKDPSFRVPKTLLRYDPSK
jgi:hypothetical protein